VCVKGRSPSCYSLGAQLRPSTGVLCSSVSTNQLCQLALRSARWLFPASQLPVSEVEVAEGMFID
jgi:hypothetical protein